MKKRLILILPLILLVTACSISKININNYDEVINKVLKYNNTTRANKSFDGYKFYLPRGMMLLNKDDYNCIIRDKDNNKYYLYLDVVSYYHKVKSKYIKDDSSYYSKEINSKDKFGYLEINKVDNKYFIEAMYNYAKIEVYVPKKSLNTAVLNISTILSSIDYNDKVLETLIGNNVLNYKEETFNIFKTKKKTTNFLNYVKEYDKDSVKDKSDTDEENVDVDIKEN